LKGTARLLSTVLARHLMARGALLAVGAIALPLAVSAPGSQPGSLVLLLALICATAGEILGRYLFFVSVVPKHMAAPYLPETEAA